MASSPLIFYRPTELDFVSVEYCDGIRRVTCFCAERVTRSIVPHLKQSHPETWMKWTKLFIQLRGCGYSLKRIMRLFAAGTGHLLFSWTVIERAIRYAVESQFETYSPPVKRAQLTWSPNEFHLERTTLWDFLHRGDWAVHKGDYRGNWPPQLVRNMIERYTSEGDLIVDPFVGGGTTLFEAWLLNRRSIGLDLSRMAIQTTTARLKEMEEAAGQSGGTRLDAEMKPIVVRANALNLEQILKRKGILPGDVALVCVHPPYLNSIQYTNGQKNDLSSLDDPRTFGRKLQAFAKEVYDVLAPGGFCAVLIGDVRKAGVLVPLGFQTLANFRAGNLELQDIVIKPQHHDSSSGFYTHRTGLELLLAHEYLFILRKPEHDQVKTRI